MKLSIISSVAVIAMMTTACGTVARMDKLGSGYNKADCALGWDELGYRNGSNEKGTDLDRLYGEYCPDEGYTYDALAYGRGYERGLEDKCTAELAKERFATGTHYAPRCNTVKVYADAFENAKTMAASEADRRIESLNAQEEVLRALADKMRVMSGDTQEYKDSVELFKAKNRVKMTEYQELREFLQTSRLSMDLLDRITPTVGMPVR